MKAQQFEMLSELLQSEGAIMGYRNQPDSLQKAFEMGLAVLLFDGELPIAFSALWPVPNEDWYEVGSVFVHQDYRGKKLGRKVFFQILDKAKESKKNLFLVTHNPLVVHMVYTAGGWQEATKDTWQIVPWGGTCGICDVVSDAQKKNCPYRTIPSHCRLFFMNKQ